MDDILSYYASHSPITDPGRFAFLYDDLPSSLPELFAVIHGVLLHRLNAAAYGVQLTHEQRSEQGLRSMQQRLARLHELDPAPLTKRRPPQERQVALCRDFAVFLVSILRHKGIPARMRVGYADYIFARSSFDTPETSYKADHWITEYWDAAARRWLLVDPDVGGVQYDSDNIEIEPKPGCNFLDLQRDHDFYLSGSAWKLARSGVIHSTYFRFNGHWKGFPCLRGNLLHDFQALNKLELRVWDFFDDLSLKPEHLLTVEDKALLDVIADVTLDAEDGFEKMRIFFDELPLTQVIQARMKSLGVMGETEPSALEELKPSGAEMLAALAAPRQPNPAQARLGLKPDRETDDLDMIPPAARQNAEEQLPPGMGDIIVRGARQHNLKNITVRIPRHKLVVITGVSGSGKSSLAFDTIYAEGQRRYVESLSSYARQFMEQMEKPQVDQVVGLNPTIAIEQKTLTKNPRSTVGTVTEVLDYLRVLYARVGTPHCPQCGRAVQPQSAQQITNHLAALPEGTRFQLLAPVARERKGVHLNTLKDALQQGFARARINGEIIDIAETLKKNTLQLDKNKKHNIELVVDRLIVPPLQDRQDFLTRLMDSVETALRVGEGTLYVNLQDRDEEIILSEHNACPVCNISFPKLEPNLFSFNSPLGMCDECNGLGYKLQIDPDLIITKPHLSLLDGASPWYGVLRKKKNNWTMSNLKAVAEHYQVDLNLPWVDLPEEFRHTLLYGSGGEKYEFEYSTEDGSWEGRSRREVKGIIYHANRLFRQTHSEYSRRHYLQFMSQLPCPKCKGERLGTEARFVTVGGKRLPEITSYSIASLHDWIQSLTGQLDEEQRAIGAELIHEVQQRLGFVRHVGLHYLTLNRSAPSLSAGEGQRIRLASQIGSGLVGVLYILDEPSIGLHARDHRALLDTLMFLRDLGNTVLVVEHDETTMRVSDWLIDLGPGPGILGGEVVAAGTPAEVMANPDSLTGRYLSGALRVVSKNGHTRHPGKGTLTLKGARLHNLKNVEARFPLGTLTCVTGVSGSGKSSLIGQTLYPALARGLMNAQTVPGAHDSLEGLELLDKVISITQDPIGRNPRSNPGTYAGAMDEIRRVFASTPEARALGYSAGRFSFNVKGGRCEACAGYGSKKVEMHFLPDVWVTCKECGGKRFNHQTLQVTFKGKNIADVLDMDVQEGLTFFSSHPHIARILETLHKVGLDYVKLGQSALTLSGGEAQRIKLAKELSRTATGRTIYILDEPTTGLHFADIQHLLDVLNYLVDAGNTVIVIEHNLDIIRSADWIIDLGPEGGDQGGRIIAEGTPEQVAQTVGSYTGLYLKEALKVR